MSEKPKTIAETAYSELLLGPVPQTDQDFRRAIVMAVMIGRQLEVECQGTPWQTTPPTAPGPWQIACAETDYEPQPVRVFDQAGELWVDDPVVGSYPLDVYHYNLIDLRWRPAAQP
ncbi:MAG: hypothetical protein INR62_02085 [Rhodospirillales bacterium]|nr:hypothetical protein [Acetobacter sp.]